MNIPFSAKLHLSEHFDSIQGEGNHAGYPAIFWRFKGCVLDCVFCDTAEVWKKGESYSFEELYLLFSDCGYFKLLNSHKRQLIITGGDPLLQQDRIAAFFDFCALKGERVGNWLIEVENQASLMPKPAFADYIAQWNISPKLSNSGMPEHKRIVEPVIHWFVKHQSVFKFPVRDKADLVEVNDYVRRFGISFSRVWLMPICSSLPEHAIVGRAVIELAKQEGYRFSPRLQLAFYDKVCGV